MATKEGARAALMDAVKDYHHRTPLMPRKLEEAKQRLFDALDAYDAALREEILQTASDLIRMTDSEDAPNDWKEQVISVATRLKTI